ncbi:MAG: hypothetical protein OCD02_18590 [Spirochaetaceae bacterium]
MIILLTGASSTGKTFIAQKILEKFKFTFYSVDHIKMGLFRGDVYCKFTPTDDDEKITKYLAPILEGIIRTALENNQNLVLEGCYFEANSISQIKNDYPNEIVGISIVMDEKYCRENFDTNVKKYRSIIESRGYAEDRSLEQFIIENREFKNFSNQNGFKVFEVVDKYENMIDQLLTFLDKKLSMPN